MPDEQYNPNYLQEFIPAYKKPDGTYVSHYVEITYNVEHEFVELGKVVDPDKPITVTLDDGKSLSRSMIYPLANPSTNFFYFEQETNRIWLDPSYIGRKVKVGFYSAGDVVRNEDITNIANAVDSIQEFLEGPQRQFLDEYAKYKSRFDEWDKKYTNLLPLPHQIQHMQQQIDYILKMLEKLSNLSAGNIQIGTPLDGSYSDGYLGGISSVSLFPTDFIAVAIDKINEALKEIYASSSFCRDPILKNAQWNGTFSTGMIYANNLGNNLIGGQPAKVVRLGTPITFESDLSSSIEYLLYFDQNNDTLKENWNIPLGTSCDFPQSLEYDGTLVSAILSEPKKYLDIFRNFYDGKLSVEFKTENLEDGYVTLRVSLRTNVDNIKHQAIEKFMIEYMMPIEFELGVPDINITNQEYNYLSGIAYLKNALVEIYLPKTNNLVQNTLKQYPINISMDKLGNIKNVSYSELWGRVPNAWESLQPKTLSFTIPQNKMQLSNDTIRIILSNVFNSEQIEFTFPYWVNNQSCSGSNWLREEFCSETYRLPLDTYDYLPNPAMNVWDSTEMLVNQPIIYNNKLVHPNYVGNIQTSPDHIYFFNSNQQFVDYIRMFKGNQPRNNGILQLNGNFVFGNNLKVYIKLPGQTGWLDLSKYFDLGTFTGADGDGAATKYENISNGIKIYWTSGTNSTAYTDYSYILKISIANGCYLDNIAEIGW